MLLCSFVSTKHHTLKHRGVLSSPDMIVPFEHVKAGQGVRWFGSLPVFIQEHDVPVGGGYPGLTT